MIDSLIIAQNINKSQADFINKKTDIRDHNRESEYLNHGLSKPLLQHVLDDTQHPGYDRTYLLSFTLTPTRYIDCSGDINIDKLIDDLATLTDAVHFNGRPWILEQITFSQLIPTDCASTYVNLLNTGYSMQTISMVKTVNDTRPPTTLSYTSDRADLTIDAIGNNMLRLHLIVKKSKLKDVYDSRNIDHLRNSKDLERAMWNHYITELTGTGDYYTYDKADDIMRAAGVTRKMRDRYGALLRCVTHYKGVEHFLEHLGGGDVNLPDAEQFKSAKTAQAAIRDLAALGINPVTLSRRMKLDHLDNVMKPISALQL